MSETRGTGALIDPAGAARAERIRYEQVSALANQSLTLAVISLTAAGVVLRTFWFSDQRHFMLIFLVVLCVMHAAGIFGSRRWLTAARRQTTVSLVRVRLIVIAIIAIFWGLVPIHLMPTANADQKMILVYIFAGLGSASMLLAPLMPAALVLVLSSALGMLAALPGSDSRMVVPLSVLVVIWAVGHVIIIRIQNRIFVRRVVNEQTEIEQREIIAMLLKNFEEHASDWLWEIDPLYRLSRVPDRLGKLLGCDKETLHGLDLRGLIHRSGPPTVGEQDNAARLLACLESRETFRDLPVVLRLGQQTRWVTLTGEPVVDEFGRFRGYRGVGADVTAAQLSSERIAHLARHDSLTDLPNRAMFQESLERLCRGGSAFALLFLDLDGFKAVNDTLGHAMGDALLIAVAGRLRGCVREGDMVARLGGDEFAVLQADSDAGGAELLATRLIATIAEPFRIGQVPASIGVSIGIALSDGSPSSVTNLLQGADLALYKSKRAGRGVWHFFETGMAERARARHALQTDLAAAIEQEALTLEFQPILDIGSGQIIAAEALVRWHHPERGRVPPADFIPIAEESGLIVALGRWVLREACAQAAGWTGPVRVAVNLSPLQFHDPGLLAVVDEALADTGLPASRLELEITETVFLEAAERTLSCLRALRSRGIHIALDDFGTGYSSLSYLRSFPFDKVKIDQSFIRDLSVDDDAIAIVQAIVGMASSLGMRTTGEGVETREQARMLKQTGCSQVQGFLFGRPCAAEAIAALIHQDSSSVSEARAKAERHLAAVP